MLIKFVRDSFRVIIEIVLWLILIGCVIGGAFIGYGIAFVEGAILGVLVGLMVGIIIIVIAGGYIATILNIDENLEITAKKMDYPLAEIQNIYEILKKMDKKCGNSDETKKAESL